VSVRGFKSSVIRKWTVVRTVILLAQSHSQGIGKFIRIFTRWLTIRASYSHSVWPCARY